MERKMDYYLIPFLSLAQIPVHLSITYDEVSFRVKIFNLLVFVHLDYIIIIITFNNLVFITATDAAAAFFLPILLLLILLWHYDNDKRTSSSVHDEGKTERKVQKREWRGWVHIKNILSSDQLGQ